MSSAVPVIAPWQPSLEKYSVQVYKPVPVTFQNDVLTVPVNQWYRVVWWMITWTTSADVANRTLEHHVTAPDGRTALSIFQAYTQTATQVATYMFAPRVDSFVNSTVVNGIYSQTGIPDVLWGPGYAIKAFFSGATVNDTRGSNNAVGVEVYAEDRHGALVPALTPTPLIS